jgi:hypothetical protein
VANPSVSELAADVVASSPAFRPRAAISTGKV